VTVVNTKLILSFVLFSLIISSTFVLGSTGFTISGDNMLTGYAAKVEENEITGAVTYNSTQYSRHWEKMSSTVPTKFLVNDDSFSITEVWINLNNPLENMGMNIIWWGLKPPTVSQIDGIVYKYYEIISDQPIRSNLRKSQFLYKIPITWADKNNLDPATVAMKAHSAADDQWTDLETRLIGSDSDYYIYESAFTSLGKYYAIAGNAKPVSAVAPVVQEPVSVSSCSSTTLILVVSAIVLLVVLLRYYFASKSKKKAKKSKK
jgi:PGF-pre-PGF domain-containing protein